MQEILYQGKKTKLGYKLFWEREGNLAPVLSPFPKFYFRNCWNERDEEQGPYALFCDMFYLRKFYLSHFATHGRKQFLGAYSCLYVHSRARVLYLHESANLGEMNIIDCPTGTVLANAFIPVKEVTI